MIVDCIVLIIYLRMPLSMDTIGEQLVHRTFINAQHWKIEKDKTRVWRGNVQRKRLHILRYPAKLAFRGWEVLEFLTYTNCKDYIMRYHIDKKFLSK